MQNQEIGAKQAPCIVILVIMVSKEHIRVFVDTNVDASILFIEPGATTIGELKRT